MMSLYTQIGAFVALAVTYAAFAFAWTWYRRSSEEAAGTDEGRETEERP